MAKLELFCRLLCVVCRKDSGMSECPAPSRDQAVMFPGAQSRGTDSPRLSPSLRKCLAQSTEPARPPALPECLAPLWMRGGKNPDIRCPSRQACRSASPPCCRSFRFYKPRTRRCASGRGHRQYTVLDPISEREGRPHRSASHPSASRLSVSLNLRVSSSGFLSPAKA